MCIDESGSRTPLLRSSSRTECDAWQRDLSCRVSVACSRLQAARRARLRPNVRFRRRDRASPAARGGDAAGRPPEAVVRGPPRSRLDRLTPPKRCSRAPLPRRRHHATNALPLCGCVVEGGSSLRCPCVAAMRPPADPAVHRQGCTRPQAPRAVAHPRSLRSCQRRDVALRP